ncbi:hypothetical protein [Legionella spiritensis]|uniref:Coiled-coil protein n=1 Tax=Legionella spiritensis TaxID=452 RepID=A0A0W0Z038_LEGSP|nr:hypothetical protein [Legionella spiritensis]KTD62270.1 hypothetical protein Lspi_2120 [Legionella spiritensis]SNV28603.1 Uncharacterised protein [Legionella spiritensis]VEG91698.1 Uncharacterised protein [Legionella spiritensis]
MTIFLDIAKQLVKEKLEAERRRSESTASGYITGFFVDKALSSEKQRIINDTILKISLLEDAGDDEINSENIEKLIDECKTEAKKKCSGKEIEKDKIKDEGHHGRAMIKINGLLNGLYKRFNEENIKLLNQSSDNDPFNVLCYWLGMYLAKREMILHYPESFLLSLFNIPALVNEKEQLVLAKIAKCQVKLGRLDKHHDEYQDARRDCVAECLKELKDENEILCAKYAWTPKLPFDFVFLGQITFSMPEIGPDTGFLEMCLSKATQAIKPMVKAEEKSALSY